MFGVRREILLVWIQKQNRWMDTKRCWGKTIGCLKPKETSPGESEKSDSTKKTSSKNVHPWKLMAGTQRTDAFSKEDWKLQS